MFCIKDNNRINLLIKWIIPIGTPNYYGLKFLRQDTCLVFLIKFWKTYIGRLDVKTDITI